MNNLIDGLSMNIEQTNLDKLRSVFPECVSEGKLDIDKLLSLCGEYIGTPPKTFTSRVTTWRS